jgi:hypothetical protein
MDDLRASHLPGEPARSRKYSALWSILTGGRYGFKCLRQPGPHPDRLRLRIQRPAGYRLERLPHLGRQRHRQLGHGGDRRIAG